LGTREKTPTGCYGPFSPIARTLGPSIHCGVIMICRATSGTPCSCVEDLLQAARRESIAAEPELLDLVAMRLRAAADRVDRHVLVGRREQCVLRHVFANHGDDRAEANRLARAHPLHYAGEMRIGLVAERGRDRQHPLARGRGNLRRAAQRARDGHQRDAGAAGDVLQRGGSGGHGR